MSAHTAHATAHETALSRGSNRSPRSGRTQHRRTPGSTWNIAETALQPGIEGCERLYSADRDRTAVSTGPPTDRPRSAHGDRPRRERGFDTPFLHSVGTLRRTSHSPSQQGGCGAEGAQRTAARHPQRAGLLSLWGASSAQSCSSSRSALLNGGAR